MTTTALWLTLLLPRASAAGVDVQAASAPSVPDLLWMNGAHAGGVRVSGTTNDLPGSPRTLTCGSVPLSTPTPLTTPTPVRIEVSGDFVAQHYLDFLSREPDADGLAFWTGEIESCEVDAACREVKRINVSAAFFLSIEFQETSYLAYRMYKAAYGDLPGAPVPLRRAGFVPDTARLGRGVVVGREGWRGQLEAFGGDFQRGEMVKAFLASDEYRRRFER